MLPELGAPELEKQIRGTIDDLWLLNEIGAQLHMPKRRRTRFTQSRSPQCALIVASMVIATARAVA